MFGCLFINRYMIKPYRYLINHGVYFYIIIHLLCLYNDFLFSNFVKLKKKCYFCVIKIDVVWLKRQTDYIQFISANIFNFMFNKNLQS